MKPYQMSERTFRDALAGQRPAIDLEWFAVDHDDHIAGFTTAGFGEFPSRALQDRRQLNRAYEVIAAFQHIGEAVWVCEPPPIGDTWTTWAEKGMFGYDWDQRHGGPYRKFCNPTNPIRLSTLPPDVAEWLAPIRFATLSFRQANELFVYPHIKEVI